MRVLFDTGAVLDVLLARQPPATLAASLLPSTQAMLIEWNGLNPTLTLLLGS